MIAKSVVKVDGLAGSYTPDRVWKRLPLVVIDFETTGLNPENDRVLEMGLVFFRDGKFEDRHNWLINPGMPVPKESSDVHGITDEQLADAPFFEQIFDEVLGHLKDRVPVAYNAPFDRKFLHAEAARLGYGGLTQLGDVPPALDTEAVWIDPLVWVRELQKFEKGKKLTDVAARMNIPLDNAHRASGDAEATGHVLMALAKDMPESYGELVRIQGRYSAQQEAEFAAWRAKRKG